MSVLTSLGSFDSREEKLLVDIGETTLRSGIAYLGAIALKIINPMSAAVYMGSVWGINAIANRIFKNSPNQAGIVFAFHIGAMFVVAYSVGITLLNAVLIEGITILALISLKYLHRNIL